MNKPDTESFQGLPSTISNNQESLKKEEEWPSEPWGDSSDEWLSEP